MDLATIIDGADRFVAYVEELTSVIGHAERALPPRDYCAGLLTAEGRKSVEPMAAVTAPAQVSVQHQKLLHFVGEGKWSDESVLAKVRELVMPAIERHGPIKAWIIDDTSYPRGDPFGRRAPSVLRTTRQAGQLSGGGDAVDRQSSCQPADRLSTVSAEGLGRRCRATQQGACARGDPLQDQAADRAGPAWRGAGGGRRARRRADGCELRYQQRAACRDRRAGAHLCGRHPADRQSAGGGRSGSARERQAAGAEFTEPRLAHHHP